ncbi:MAG: hypothetical protein U0514_00570 [Candidatus Andersenbacteria bacterium]
MDRSWQDGAPANLTRRARPRLLKDATDAREWGAVFVRIDPPVAPTLAGAFTELGFKPAASQVQPRVTARLDLTLGRDHILAGM